MSNSAVIISTIKDFGLPILGAVVGYLGTLTGQYLSARQNKKRYRVQQLEYCYISLSNLQTTITESSALPVIAKRHPTPENFKKVTDQYPLETQKINSEFMQIHTLLDLYLPRVIEDLEAVISFHKCFSVEAIKLANPSSDMTKEQVQERVERVVVHIEVSFNQIKEQVKKEIL